MTNFFLRRIILLLLVPMVVSGCARATLPVQLSTPSPTLPPQENVVPIVTPLPTVRTQDDDMPKDPPLPFSRSPGLQALIDRVKADLAQRLSISASQINVIETKEAAWPDASLGCPEPGTTTIQIPTPGYIVLLKAEEKEYEYHAGIHGNTLLCENPTPPISGTPADIYPFPVPAP